MISLLTVLLCFLASIAAKLRLEGVSEFELSPGPPPLTVAAYVPGAKVSVKYAYILNYLLYLQGTFPPQINVLWTFLAQTSYLLFLISKSSPGGSIICTAV